MYLHAWTRVRTPPGKSWKITLVLEVLEIKPQGPGNWESPGKISLKVMVYFSGGLNGRQAAIV